MPGQNSSLFNVPIWTMGAFFPGSESESTNGRLVFGLPPIGCCSPCLLSSHNGVPLCLLFYSLLSQSWCCLFPDSGGEEQYGLLYPFPLCPCPTESALCQSVTNFSLHLAQIGLYVFCIPCDICPLVNKSSDFQE